SAQLCGKQVAVLLFAYARHLKQHRESGRFTKIKHPMQTASHKNRQISCVSFLEAPKPRKIIKFEQAEKSGQRTDPLLKHS
ncbi:hypothetical protein GBF38_008334, partial [Nibea albiflora]